MKNSSNLIRQITPSISIEIVPHGNAGDLNGKVWAINWFSYQKQWLYGLYYRLAAPYAARMGGQMLFKGHNQKTLYGDENLSRQTLLIVSYPKIDNFLEMVSVRAFQLISLLRVKAVKNFVFGFTKRLDGGDTAMTGSENKKSFMVFHYQGVLNQSGLIQLAADGNLKIFFHGEKIGQVKRIEVNKEPVLAPFFMDGLFLFTADSEHEIEKFVDTENFDSICKRLTSGYAAMLNKVN